MFQIRPRNNRFFVLLDEEAANVREGAAQLLDLFQRYVEIQEKVERIKAVERQGDNITRTIMEQLNDTFITPIEREDISALAFTLDEVLDRVHGVAERAMLYKIDKPTATAIEMAQTLHEAVAELARLVSELHDLHLDRMDDGFAHIKNLEEKADRLYRTAVAELLNDETRSPFAAIKWKELYENLEDGLDFCEDVANLIKGVTVKNA